MFDVKIEMNALDMLILKLTKFSKRIFDIANKTLAEVTDETAAQLRMAILMNRPRLIDTSFRRISPAWRAEKRRKGWRTETLVRKELYAKAIRTRHEGDTHSIYLPDETYPDHNFSYKDLGNYLEKGTRSTAAIPHWRPAEQWLLRRFRRVIGKRLVNALLRR